ncbi:unnamed protein product [Scytosiphon promiscuus]
MGRRRPNSSSSRRLAGATLVGVLGLVGGGSAFFVGGRSGLLASSWSTIREWGQAKVGGETSVAPSRDGGGGSAAAGGAVWSGTSLFSSVVATVKPRNGSGGSSGIDTEDRPRRAEEDNFIRFKSYGDTSKQPLVIVPGLDGATAFFSDIVPELTLNFHVVVFNLPLASSRRRAAGRGGGGGDSSESYDMPFIARRLAEVMDDAGITGGASIVGESFGGMVAQRFAIDFPDKVDGLVLLSSLAKPELSRSVRFKTKFILPMVEGIGFLLPFLAQSLFSVAHLPDVVEKHEPLWAKRLFLKEASWADHRSVMARTKIALAFDSTEELKKIKTGALVLFGKDDSFTSTGTQQLLDGIEGSREMGLPGGHLCHITNPKAFSEAVTDYLLTPA